MRKVSLFIVALFAFVAFLPLNALACACCAEPGEYSIRTQKPEAYTLELLNNIKFDNAGYLYMNEAGFDMIKGLEGIAKDFESDSWVAAPGRFDLANTFAAKTWKFNFKTPTGKTGTLTVPMPMQMLSFKADIHNGEGGGGGPLLYKEWRFKGNLQSGSGFFQAGFIKPTTYFLVLQGRGNNCDNAEDFSHWRLEIDGKKAKYAFFGKLSSGTSDETEEQ